ncbi:MAG: hypothetical protein K5780_04070 [Alphaproteobacteria bacterium]|nr:hypothetical protein [Alphaproteobacteria bacterium]
MRLLKFAGFLNGKVSNHFAKGGGQMKEIDPMIRKRRRHFVTKFPIEYLFHIGVRYFETFTLTMQAIHR